MKRFFLLLLSCIWLLSSHIPADGHDKTTELAARSLPSETIARFKPAPVFYDGDEKSHCYAGRSRHVSEYYLLAPLNEPERFVAIAERKPAPASFYVLNPQPASLGFDYGQLPPLKDVDCNQADELYGIPFERKNQIRKYKLTSVDKEQFLLELEFAGNKILKYRIARVSFATVDKLTEAQLPAWHELN